jgi:DNA invertase Pin-like site-specific DNA recombinase
MGHKNKLTSQQIAHARKLIEKGADRKAVAASFKVNHTTLYPALGG